MKITKRLLALVFLVFVTSCGPQYVQDPNARVIVTSQYESEPIKIISLGRCKPKVDCTNKSEAVCTKEKLKFCQEEMGVPAPKIPEETPR
jgi:hypothetical protein